MGRYENLNRDLETIRLKIGLPEPLSLPALKNQSRTDKRHYSQVLSDNARGHIERICARELDYFSYSWEAS